MTSCASATKPTPFRPASRSGTRSTTERLFGSSGRGLRVPAEKRPPFPRRNRVEVLPRCENRLSALVLRKCLAAMVQHKMRALWTKRDFGKKRRLGGGCGGEQDASSGFQQLLP